MLTFVFARFKSLPAAIYLKHNRDLSMSLVPQIPNPYLEAISVGLLYGLVYCTPTCLPYLASYIAGVGADFRKGTMATLVFNFGRIASYALIGGLVGILAGVFRFVVTESTLAAFQQYSSIVFGIITIIIGVAVYLKSRAPKHDCPAAGNPNPNPISNKGLRARFDVGAFSLGLSRGLILCPPLVFLLLYSIPFGTPIDSFLLAVLFGLGTAISPMLLLGGVSGWLLNKAPLFRKWIALAGALILIILGIAALANPLFS